jgi:hypothetical protein
MPSYAEVVRGGVNAPRTSPAPRRPEVNHRGRITSSEATRERRIDSGRKVNPRKIWRLRQHTVEPAGSPLWEPGWTPAKRRRRITRRSSPRDMTDDKTDAVAHLQAAQ